MNNLIKVLRFSKPLGVNRSLSGFLLVAVQTCLFLLAGCGQSGGDSGQMLAPSEIKVLVGRPGAEKAALYILEITNKGDGVVRDIGGELYLLDILTGEHMVLSSTIREITSNGKGMMLWELPSNTPIAEKWKEWQLEEYASRQSYATSHAPAIQAYVKVGGRYRRINSDRYTLYYTVQEKKDALQPARIEVNPSAVKKFFDDHGIKLPQGELLTESPVSANTAHKSSENDATDAVLKCNWSKAIESARQWAAADQENPIPHFILNVSYTYSGAREQLKAEIPLAYGTPERIQRVAQWARQIAEKNPTIPCAQQLAGLASEVSGDKSAAVKYYEQAIRLDPRFKQSYEALGTLYLADRQTDKALKAYSDILTFLPNDPSAHIHIANVYIMKDDIKTATSYLEKGVNLDPFDAEAHYNLAMAYFQQGQTQKAKEMFQKVIKLDPVGEVGRDAKDRIRRLSE